MRAGDVLRASLAALALFPSSWCLAQQHATAPTQAAPAADPPNIVLILADDLGFTDIAPYGSEINTPTLSMLAQAGVRFTNYHSAANCAPARAMLLTGVDNHLAGVPNIPEMLSSVAVRRKQLLN